MRASPEIAFRWLALGGATALGLVVGSFLNVVIHRLPAGKSIVSPRSACPLCGRPIPWNENIPLLSFLMLGAKCRGCRAPISWRYPLVEVLTGGLFALAAWLLLPAGRPEWWTDPAPWVHVAAAFVFLGTLVALTFIDFDHRILPDRLTKPGMAAGAVFSVALAIAGEGARSLQPTEWIPSLPATGAALLLSLAGMVAGYGSLWLVGWLGEKAFRREAMGLGDAKLLAMVGAFTGPQGALLAAGVGMILGLVLGLVQQARTRDTTFPFGPALAAGGAAVFLAPAGVLEGFRSVAALSSDPRGGLGLAVLCAVLLVMVRGRLPKAMFVGFLVLVLLLAAVNGVLLFAGPPR
jgi:leader peptidase (prepilin peptidase)/N-methyltransferase